MIWQKKFKLKIYFTFHFLFTCFCNVCLSVTDIWHLEYVHFLLKCLFVCHRYMTPWVWRNNNLVLPLQLDTLECDGQTNNCYGQRNICDRQTNAFCMSDARFEIYLFALILFKIISFSLLGCKLSIHTLGASLRPREVGQKIGQTHKHTNKQTNWLMQILI